MLGASSRRSLETTAFGDNAMHRRLFLAALPGLTLPAGAASAAASADLVRQALAAPDRKGQIEVDKRRHPGELVIFAGVRPGTRVVDLIPGSGYFTRIFSKVVGPQGRVYALWPDEYAKESHPDPENSDALARQPGYGNIRVLRQPARSFATPEPVDVVFTSQNYHDYPDKFMGRIDPVAFDRQVYAALKPGGVFVVVDHVAQAGSGLRDTDTLHRIDPALVKAQATQAGFVFAGSSEVLRNPADDHKRLVFDKALRGHTDQFVYKFRKPLKRG